MTFQLLIDQRHGSSTANGGATSWRSEELSNFSQEAKMNPGT